MENRIGLLEKGDLQAAMLDFQAATLDFTGPSTKFFTPPWVPQTEPGIVWGEEVLEVFEVFVKSSNHWAISVLWGPEFLATGCGGFSVRCFSNCDDSWCFTNLPVMLKKSKDMLKRNNWISKKILSTGGRAHHMPLDCKDYTCIYISGVFSV